MIIMMIIFISIITIISIVIGIILTTRQSKRLMDARSAGNDDVCGCFASNDEKTAAREDQSTGQE